MTAKCVGLGGSLGDDALASEGVLVVAGDVEVVGCGKWVCRCRCRRGWWCGVVDRLEKRVVFRGGGLCDSPRRAGGDLWPGDVIAVGVPELVCAEEVVLR